MNDLNIVLSELKNVDRSTLDILYFLLRKKEEAMNSNNNELVKQLDLLSSIFTIELQNNDSNRPYTPYCRTSRGQIFDIYNISDEEICLFIEMSASIEHRQLKARIMDILWLTKERWKNLKCNVIASTPIKYAEQVMEAYLPSSINKDCWQQWVFREIFRCAILAKQTKKTTIIDRLIKLLESMIMSSTIDDKIIPLDSLQIIITLDSQYCNTEILQKIEAQAKGFINNEDASFAYFAQIYYATLSDIYKNLGEKNNAVRFKIEEGHYYMKEGERSTSINNYLRATICYMFAFNTYRAVPKSFRKDYNVEQLISESQEKQIETGKKVHLNGYRIEQPINLEPFVNEIRTSVTGKSLYEIISYICTIGGPNVDEMHKAAENRLNNSLLHYISTIKILAADGRTIKDVPSYDGSNEVLRETHIQLMMLQSYSCFIGITVYGLLFPALDILGKSYQITEQDIQEIVKKSSLIPKDRMRQWTMGLLAGFQQNFVVAIHLLAPQIEHLIRIYLKNNFKIDTMTTIDGEQSEKGLSTLMKDDIINQALGANFAFEIRALFCDKAGPNLRNNIAHGLLSDDRAESDFTVYAWWLALKIVLNPECIKK